MQVQLVTIKVEDLVKIVDEAVARQFAKINNQDRLLEKCAGKIWLSRLGSSRVQCT